MSHAEDQVNKVIPAPSAIGSRRMVDKWLAKIAKSIGTSRGTLLLIVALGTAFFLTHMDISGTIMDERNLPRSLRGIDKAYHFVSYSGLTFLLLFVGARPVKTSYDLQVTARRLVLLSCVVIGYAIFDEVSQPLFNRNLEWLDLLANCVGIATGQMLFVATEMTGWRRPNCDHHGSA